jgi:hypothetical protein
MSGLKDWTTTIVVIVVAVLVIYLIDPTFFGLMKSVSGFKGSRAGREHFTDAAAAVTGVAGATSTGEAAAGQMSDAGKKMEKENKEQEHVAKFTDGPAVEGFSDMEGAADFASAAAPAGCYAREQINPAELLPKESGVWAEQNPSGPGSLKGKNFLSAGALIGINTIGQSLKNASWDLRSEPANPQVPVSIFNNSTFQPDLMRRPLEIQ